MIRRFLPLALVALLLLPLLLLVPAASAQTSGTPVISLTSQYIVNGYGFVILNETVAFQNNGTSTLQIPTVQLGLPDSVASHSSGWVIASQQSFSQTNTNNGNVTTFTIVPGSPSLGAGDSVSVSLKSLLSNVFDISAGASGPFNASILASPSLNQNVSTMDSEIALPADGLITPAPGGFLLESGTPTPIYSNTTKAETPTISLVSTSFSDSSETYWEPMQVYSVVREIIPSPNSSPQVEDIVSIQNLANYSISEIPVSFLAPGLGEATAVPTTTTPNINPTPVNITDGVFDVATSPYANTIAGGDNFTFGLEYTLPSSYMSVSGTTVTISTPYLFPIAALVQNYTVELAPTSGINPIGQSSYTFSGVTPVTEGSVVLKYSVNLAWGASEALPIAALIFAATFTTLGLVGRTKATTEEEEEEEGEEMGERVTDMIKAFEDKIALFQQFEADMKGKSQGTVPRSEFNKARNEMDSMKARANGRLNGLRQTTSMKRNLDLLNQLQEASREEDRAAKDLLNLYDQYQSRRMRGESFDRLLPNYKRRYDSAINHLSDLLNLAQREGKQG